MIKKTIYNLYWDGGEENTLIATDIHNPDKFGKELDAYRKADPDTYNDVGFTAWLRGKGWTAEIIYPDHSFPF